MTIGFHYLNCLGPHGFFRMGYTRWTGPRPDGRPVLCVHGLTRNSRDFDFLAERLALRGPVVAPDMPGRGRSDWLEDPADYGYPLYQSATAALIGAIGADEVDFVGTSMGGLIGMLLASQKGSPIRRLVLNDIGPLIPQAALERLGTYVGRDPAFDDLAGLEFYLRRIAAGFGPLTDGQWRHLAAHGARQRPDGRVGLAYDPAIGRPFQGELKDVDLWPVYDRITCPVLVIRGGVSDLLLRRTAEEMTVRGPRAELWEAPGIGHAPALMAPDQIAAIEQFFDRTA